MSRVDVVVIGDGVAGVAAAFAAARAGAKVLVVSRGNGATTLSSGAVDRFPWDALRENQALIDADERSFLDAMGLWQVADEPVRLATLWGAMRSAVGRDRALLDISPYQKARILVPRVDRPGWDADLLAVSWSEQPWSHTRDVAFVPIDASLVQEDPFLYATDAEFAMSLDDAGVFERFADRLSNAVEGAGRGDAVLLGPWLGVRLDVASLLAQRLSMQVGETLCLLGGTTGARFEFAAGKMMDDNGVERRCDWVKEIRATREGWEAHCRDDGQSVSCKAVVVACGSFVGGGVVLTSAEQAEMCEVPPRPTTPFSLSFESPLCLAVDGHVNHFVASLQGLNLERLAWPRSPQERWILDRVNVFHDGAQALDAVGSPIRGVFVGGEVAYDHAQAMLSSIATGLRAGAAAAAFAM